MDRRRLGRRALLALDLTVMTGSADALMIVRIDEQPPITAMRLPVVDHSRGDDVAPSKVALT